MPVAKSPMIDAPVLVKRYVYDLHEAVADLNSTGAFTPPDPTAEAWIVEHLRSYHRLDVDELGALAYRSDVATVEERCGRLAQALTKRLYKLFRPMAMHAMEAAFTDIQFKHKVLSVSIYDIP